MPQVTSPAPQKQPITVTLSPTVHAALLALLDKESRECSLNAGELEALRQLKTGAR